tara:strand:- start:170 stop:448 length:279 start_codon:yes stop_codon:yes gene_type:complete
MINFIVIGICILLLLLVVYIAAKPISMGIEARRNLSDKNNVNEMNDQATNNDNFQNYENKSISDELIALSELKKKGVLSEEEYEKAKKKLLS